MGWGYGILADGREAGYNVVAKCEEPGCLERIDRGLAYLCGMMHGQDDEEGCGHYFCSRHLFYGGPNQMCAKCLKDWEEFHPENDSLLTY